MLHAHNQPIRCESVTLGSNRDSLDQERGRLVHSNFSSLCLAIHSILHGSMTRRADPEDIYMARRAATFRRLADVERLDELDAEHWIAAWEREGERLGLERHSQAFWEAGRRWIGERRSAGRKPLPS